MAVNNLQFPIDIIKNNNSSSPGYGKFYGFAHNAETLSTEGLVDHITKHNCAVGKEAIAAVIKKLSECVPELVAQGQPVKIDGLGIFYGTVSNRKNGIMKDQLLDNKVNPLDVVEGIHLRFTPQSDQLNDLTSKSFLKQQVSPVMNLVMDPKGIDLTPDEPDPAKKKYATAKATLQEFRASGGFPTPSQG